MLRRNLIVVTGATGFVGQQLVPMLAEQCQILIVSRTPVEAARRFPYAQICSYDELKCLNLVGSTFVHLAVRNNDKPGTQREFEETNVDFLLEVASIAKKGGAVKFINVCSTHALEPALNDLYGQSKKAGAERLRSFWPGGAVNLYVPIIYGHRFGGRMRILNRLPAVARPLVLSLFRLVKPTLSVDHLGNFLIIMSETGGRKLAHAYRSENYLADPIPAIGIYAGIKRAIDLVAAFAIFSLLGWAMILIALYVRYDSEGPAIFAQKRVGKDGRVFTCFKFRTMAIGTANLATHETSISSVTKAGRFLRQTKLDELPQVINLLRNDMSLVGPRPCLPIQQELIKRRVERDVPTLKPGITGLAQINGVDMSDAARLAALDDRYRAFRTLLGDGVIMLRTMFGGGSGDRVRSDDHD